MNIGQAALLLNLVGVRGCLREILARQHHFGPQVLGALDLCKWCPLGHDYGDRYAEAAGVVGDALGVVTSRGGDDAARALIRIQLQKPVQSPTLLKRGRVLENLEFEADIGAGDL